MSSSGPSRSEGAEQGTERSEELTFEDRKRFGCFGPEDTELVNELRPMLAQHAEVIVERFYAHLQATPALRGHLADPALVARLKEAQKGYLLSLADGAHDEAYAETRRGIGRTHERIGLEPQWYLGTYGLYIELLLPRLHAHYPGDPAKAVRASVALSKLLILDMQLALDAYYETRHRKEMQKSEQLAAVGELAASIAHEVRNPLAGMKGALEILRTELVVKPSNREIVDELLAQIARLENLVRDLLTFARPTALAPRELDLHETIDRILRLHKDEADAARITVHRVYGPGTGRIRADLQQLEQVFLNLIHNAFQAMETGGTLTVATQAARGRILISFRDTGRGIPAADLRRVFQPFFTTKHRGSGLGLPIVKKIIQAHGGFVEVDSAVGEGTTVTLALPGGRGASD